MKMKMLSFLMMAVFAFAMSSCDKDKDGFGKKGKKECTLCEKTIFQDPNVIPAETTQYIVAPLVLNEACGCYESGYVKYVKNNQTVALVKYFNASKDGSCEPWGFITYCFDGDCKSKKASYCKFPQSCAPNGN